MPSKESNTEDEYAPSAWASRDFDFSLPSGGKCLLRKLDPLVAVELGLADKLDFATSVVMNKHVKNAQMSNVERIKRDRARREAKAKGEDPDEAEESALQESLTSTFMKDPTKIKDFREVVDSVLIAGVVKPEMHLPPEKEDDRVVGRFYTDAVPYADKIAVFNKLMAGVRVTEQFREESEETVGDVAPKPSVRKPAQRRSRNPAK